MAMSVLITLASIFSFVAETHYVFQQLRLSNGSLLPAPKPESPATAAINCCCGGLESEHITNHTPDATNDFNHNETGSDELLIECCSST